MSVSADSDNDVDMEEPKTPSLQPGSHQGRKTQEQISALMEILGNAQVHEITAAQRRECERRTGLKWIQVYKWIFDRRNKGKPRKRPAKKFASGNVLR